ncbi:MAG: helix-turn-helix transcriptional regulator [Eubacteriales bacterium]|nr:helix-turn-helix transcriptional regulator [Eubacteriales bacterium]
MTFAEKLRMLRKDRRFTQAAMAQMLGVSPRAYQNYEEGKTYPKDSSLYQKLASFFDVTVDFLMNEDDEGELASASEARGSRSRMQAQKILLATEALYAGGSLSDEDEEAFYQHMLRIYEHAKQRRAEAEQKK